MTYIPNPMGVRVALLGLKVDRATAALPQSTLGNIFTVTGGRVVITSLVGEVTTVLGAGANSLTLGYAPTVGVGDATVLGAGAVSVLTAPVGTHIAANPGGDVFVDLATQAGIALPVGHLLVDVGSVTVTTAGSVTGSVKWSITYIPYEDAATVVAA